MASVNKVTLLGHLGGDPEIGSANNGKAYAKFSLATTESYKNDQGERVDKTEWHNVVFWGPLCNVISKYLSKGSQLYLEGKLTHRSYEKDGQTKYFTEILGSNLVLLGSKPTHNTQADEDLNDLPF